MLFLPAAIDLPVGLENRKYNPQVSTKKFKEEKKKGEEVRPLPMAHTNRVFFFFRELARPKL